MACLNQMLHTVKYGDSLYSIATMYNTTVEEIIANNNNLDPYNLMAGSKIVICHNARNNGMNNKGISVETVKLLDQMNALWEQHVEWTRMFLISIAENLKDLEPTKARLLQNPKDIGNLYRKYYGDAVAQKVQDLLTEHLAIGGDLIVALKNGNTTLAKNLNEKWYKNADDIAEALSSVNPYYDKEEVRKTLYDHLKLTTEEVGLRLKKDYSGDIKAYDKVEEEALKMAKYFAIGIAKQFPNKFA